MKYEWNYNNSSRVLKVEWWNGSQQVSSLKYGHVNKLPFLHCFRLFERFDCEGNKFHEFPISYLFANILIIILVECVNLYGFALNTL